MTGGRPGGGPVVERVCVVVIVALISKGPAEETAEDVYDIVIYNANGRLK